MTEFVIDDAIKLRMLSDYFLKMDAKRGNPRHEVSEDLVKIAAKIDRMVEGQWAVPGESAPDCDHDIEYMPYCLKCDRLVDREDPDHA